MVFIRNNFSYEQLASFYLPYTVKVINFYNRLIIPVQENSINFNKMS